ncbi:MAG: hypothetical protein Q9227_007490 [Pyrenula ochraceoflavens]
MAPKVESDTLHAVTEKEKELTGQSDPVKGGPTAQAQKHVGENINSETLHDITEGEKKVTGGERVKGGPTSTMQSTLAKGAIPSDVDPSSAQPSASGVMDSETISSVTAAEKEMTGEARPVKGGPTAQAQKHVGETITSEALHDITEGEKKVSGQAQPAAGGPTAAAQSELGKSRNS